MPFHQLQQSNDNFLTAYDYHLPTELIAQRPMFPRSKARLFVYSVKKNQIYHSTIGEIEKFLPTNSNIVMNNTQVFPARLIAKKESGGEAEIFLLSLIANQNGNYHAMLKCSGKKKIGQKFILSDGESAILSEIADDGKFYFNFSCTELEKYLFKHGLVPIPPYIRDGMSDDEDKKDYQTIFAKNIGSVAAPTAGLHFESQLLENIKKNHSVQEVTLHVGAGTFAPVKSEDVRQHQMHYEYFNIDQQNGHLIQKAFGNIIAVGTTSLRVLESAFNSEGNPQVPWNQLHQTNIFLHPGKKINSISGLLTNFHLPRSTLLMLVSALTGREKLLELYQLAISERYRFYSYGDAMLILED